MTRILIVEDEKTIASALQMTFELVGYEADLESNGRAALSRLECDPLPDLIIMDLHMPVMDGSVALEVMRGSERLRRVPVLLITGAVQQDLPPAGTFQGMITKPFRVQDVLAQVRWLLAENGS
jgi:two-component system alkaline phosphatase synthesis response regulator PhoP